MHIITCVDTLVCLETEDQCCVSSLIVLHPTHPSSLFIESGTTQLAPGIHCLYHPSAGIQAGSHNPPAFTWILYMNSFSHTCMSGILPIRPILQSRSQCSPSVEAFILVFKCFYPHNLHISDPEGKLTWYSVNVLPRTDRQIKSSLIFGGSSYIKHPAHVGKVV